ncbi:hypothetical protein GCM10007094_35240 [Pseudovibrio japonicus]|uniref:Uncharacterized protein n=1 Tax=Pseudovibrio japonicus TaxID=366534 RepID=A0ABQ3EN72_9HYPH|nr:hypothetical protein GCM10007094_35240 [Pseudovibrio japonicus]
MTDCVCEVQSAEVRPIGFSGLARVFSGIFAILSTPKTKVIYGRDLPPHLKRDIGFGIDSGPSIR